jgi:AcrR family transcriptional regulator
MTTREKLLDATGEVLASDGLSAVSARSIAARAEVNQALVFYHFGSVAELVEESLRRSADLAVGTYRNRFDDVTSFTELLELGREVHRAERERGNVARMAQVMAGAQGDETLARAGRYAIDLLTRQLEGVLNRLLASSPLRGLVDPSDLARAVAAAFIGLELYEGVDPDGASSALGVLESLGGMLELVDGLGAVGSRAVRGQVRKANKARSTKRSAGT